MLDPEFTKMMVADRVEQLRRDARPVPRRRRAATSSVGSVDLRLARVHDRPALDELARLDAKPAPIGQMVLAVVGERIVAALPLDGGVAIRDPFVATQHLVPLLEGRAAQLRAPKRRLIPRYVSLIRGSIHA